MPRKEAWNPSAFINWVKQEEPDVVVSKLPEVTQALRQAGYRLPADISVALHSMEAEPGPPEISGMLKHPLEVGQMAVDLLIDMLHRNETGVPALPQQLMIDGSWNEGSTLRHRLPVARRGLSTLAS